MRQEGTLWSVCNISGQKEGTINASRQSPMRTCGMLVAGRSVAGCAHRHVLEPTTYWTAAERATTAHQLRRRPRLGHSCHLAAVLPQRMGCRWRPNNSLTSAARPDARHHRRHPCQQPVRGAQRSHASSASHRRAAPVANALFIRVVRPATVPPAPGREIPGLAR